MRKRLISAAIGKVKNDQIPNRYLKFVPFFAMDHYLMDCSHRVLLRYVQDKLSTCIPHFYWGQRRKVMGWATMGHTRVMK